MYGELVYRIGKQYSKERELNPNIEFPYFSGQISELVTDDVLQDLPNLYGEHIIAYNDSKGTKHLIRVYFDDGSFEAEGTSDSLDDSFSFQSHAE